MTDGMIESICVAVTVIGLAWAAAWTAVNFGRRP